uniref:Uncharacterized protein n=1 Tax=Cacopsylla melanoneura TaxID=428564 RepID=A0A8D8R1Z6_9HEMI
MEQRPYWYSSPLEIMLAYRTNLNTIIKPVLFCLDLLKHGEREERQLHMSLKMKSTERGLEHTSTEDKDTWHILGKEDTILISTAWPTKKYKKLKKEKKKK